MPRFKLPKTKTKEYFLEINNFRGASNTLINERRLESKYATTSDNIYQVQDGIWKTRPGTTYYGMAVSGITDIDGAAEYVKSDDSTELIVVGGGNVYKSTDGGSWTQITGASLTSGERPYFLQLGSRLYIANGTDALTYYDGTDLNQFSSVSNPGVPNTPTRSTLTSGDFNNYYRVVWVNDVGFTEPSSSLNITTNKHRDEWASGEDVGFTLPTSVPASVTAVQVYWGEYDGEEVYLGSVPSTATTFTDDGSLEPNIYVETPNDNTTAAPKFRTMEVSDNRIWATYDPDNKYRVYYSGTGQYVAYFSTFYGGGWVDLEKGSRNTPVSVVHYRTGKGDSIVTVLCSSPDGMGTIFQIDLTSATIGDTSFTVPAAYKIVGSIGASAPYGVIKAGDTVLFNNKKGVYALRNKEQIFNVLSTDDLSAPIRPSFEELNGQKINEAAGYYLPPRAYFSFAKGASNDRTAIFDFERRNWTWAWTVGFNQFLEYTDSSGVTHFLAVPTSGNRLEKFDETVLSDLGEAFVQSYISPLVPVAKDATDLAKVRDVVFELGSFLGQVTVKVLGIEKGQDQNVTTLATKTVSSSNVSSNTGWGVDFFSHQLFSDGTGIATELTEPTTKIRVRVNKKVYATQFQVYANSSSTSFEILNIQAEGTLIPGRAPSAWN